MRKFNAENERLKSRYERYLREAKGQDEKSIDKTRAALVRFEETTNYKAFKKFHVDQARSFKKRAGQGQELHWEAVKPDNNRCNPSLSKGVLSLAGWTAGVQESFELFGCRVFQQ